MTFFKQNFVQLAVFKRVDFSLVAYLERDTHTSLLWPVNSNTGRFVKLANSIISHDRLYLLEHPPSRALLFCNLGHIHVTLHNYTLSIPSVVSQFFPRVTKSRLRDKLQGEHSYGWYLHWRGTFHAFWSSWGRNILYDRRSIPKIISAFQNGFRLSFLDIKFVFFSLAGVT